MHILVTGSHGTIGNYLVPILMQAGYRVRTFDLAPTGLEETLVHHSGDLRNLAEVIEAVRGTQAVVHLGGVAGDLPGQEDVLFDVNVRGTWNVLQACKSEGIRRVVYFSSINALGNTGGHEPTRTFPIDDRYTHHPTSTYQLSKHLGEEMCRAFAENHGLEAICLRPVLVTTPEHYRTWKEAGPNANLVWGKTEYWAYVDVRDVGEAVLRSLTLEPLSFDAALLAAADTVLELPTREALARFYPQTPWQREADAYFAGAPRRSLIDCSHAERLLGWRPRYRWQDKAS